MTALVTVVNALVVNRLGRPLEALGADCEAGLAEVVPVGRWALTNPGLVERIGRGAALSEIDTPILYRGGSAGYTDYPALDRSARERA